MSSGSDQIQAEFHNSAMEIFFMVYGNFQNATHLLNRRKREKEFQVFKKQYVQQLENELNYLAREILSRSRMQKQTSGINVLLGRHIKEYLHRFVVKVED
jgi:hypothetical protein